ncbi:hypothetical protein GWN63_01040 [Candidatus Bathyarchaeota archaeon]|nr:hypothetical protein [Candidatus Bathyarchaeota archaeon]NIU80823.1 hypothetical protein [Candidatus Bathyarchaeota archaeon]NIV67458.1 hypothetical protein [Candidatus Bathyarchaeota archaeon]NIW16005.1 hypothetical protein [Candidatus Bathyarchaeota archaeon]NIW34097.1 hypothetical protein [Candidatus Bathyarchaeota archaeon]
MKCSLCGYEFEEDESVMTCRGCPLRRGCNMIRCPNCGYEVPARSKLAKILKRWRKDENGTE